MKVACHQPVYFARLHLAQRWLNVDRLVWLRNVQFARKSPDEFGVQRPTGQQSTDIAELGKDRIRLTVPVSGSRQTLAQTAISGSEWTGKHLATLRSNYARMGWWDAYGESLTELLGRHHASLSDLNIATFNWVCRAIGVDGPQQLVDDGMICYGSDRIVKCCLLAEAKTYVAGKPSLTSYLDERQFADNGIVLEAQDWKVPEYSQPSAKFERNLSVLDLILSVGGDRARHLLMEV